MAQPEPGPAPAEVVEQVLEPEFGEAAAEVAEDENVPVIEEGLSAEGAEAAEIFGDFDEEDEPEAKRVRMSSQGSAVPGVDEDEGDEGPEAKRARNDSLSVVTDPKEKHLRVSWADLGPRRIRSAVLLQTVVNVIIATEHFRVATGCSSISVRLVAQPRLSRKMRGSKRHTF